MGVYEPATLQEAVVYFSDQDVCLEYVVARRWPNGVTCPTCGSADVRFIKTRRIWECKGSHTKKQFSAKTGTICEDSPLGLDKWLVAMWMVGSCKNGVSSYEIQRTVGVTQKSAWFMLHRIREAMRVMHTPKMTGTVEADETFIGGKLRNMHKTARRRLKAKEEENWGKAVVLGLLERESGEVRAKVAPNRKKKHLDPHLESNLDPSARLFTDEHPAYIFSAERPGLEREIVNHLESYVNGRVHTNGIENFWSLLKRTLGGTYISVDPHHLFRYLDEQMFRFNKRRLTDAERLGIVVTQMVNRRLTYEQLTSGE